MTEEQLTEIRRVACASGVSVGEIRKGMAEAETDDPRLGAGYSVANSLAVAIKGDRHEWNLAYAEMFAERIPDAQEEA